ncbi:dual specificity tyrosine-phosphorylation-regulated kinase 4 isoform X1 [Tachysurus ichikawai]
MTPDEGMQHEWIHEGRLNKLRPKTRPIRKSGESDANSEHSFRRTSSNRTADKSSSEDRLRRENSAKGGKRETAERLRPIGASAEEETNEGVGKNSKDSQDSKTDSNPQVSSERKSDSGERSVEIAIQHQSQSASSTDSEDPEPHTLPPIV